MVRMLICWILLFVMSGYGSEIVISGHQKSKIDYVLEQTIEPFPGIEELQASFVVPQDFQSPTYVQQVEHLKFKFSLEPDRREIKTDSRGNLVHEYTWNRPGKVINCRISLQANNEVNLAELISDVPFPVSDFPDDLKPESGLVFEFETPDGEEILGTVLSVKSDNAEVDFNHPLAGQPLVFTVEILDINNARATTGKQ